MNYIEQVMSELSRRGVTATFEYPGAVVLEVSPTENVWIGVTGWDFGTVNCLDADGVWQPVEDDHAGFDPDEISYSVEDLDDPVFVARMWVRIIERRRVLARVEQAARTAEAVFWASVAASFPETETGDLDPATAEDVSQHMVWGVREWVLANVA